MVTRMKSGSFLVYTLEYCNLLVKDSHVDDVGWPAEEKEDGQQNGRLDALRPFHKLRADDVVRIIPGKELFKNDAFTARRGGDKVQWILCAAIVK